jgi:hypothetical protein
MSITVHPLRLALWAIGGTLMIGALVMANLAIMYSSISSDSQEGWAIFCGLNAIWVFVLGFACLMVADTHDVQMRQLDWDRRRERVPS